MLTKTVPQVFSIPPEAFVLDTVHAFLQAPVKSPAVLRRYGPVMLRALGSLLLGPSAIPRRGAWVLLPAVLHAMQPTVCFRATRFWKSVLWC